MYHQCASRSLLLFCFSIRAHLVQIFVGYHPEKLEPVCCQLLCRQCRSLTALQDLEVCECTVNDVSASGLHELIITVRSILKISYNKECKIIAQ